MDKLILAVFALVLLGGCTSKPILNLKNQPISNSITGEEKSLEDVGKAIMSAAQKRGWAARSIEPGLISATILVRRHKADIEIAYTEKTFNIEYIDSHNLGYDGKNIHRNYNNWITKLAKTINNELYKISP